MKRTLLACLTAGLIISMIAVALAAVPSYAGTWALDKTKSTDVPQQWQNADISYTVVQTDKTLSVTTKGGRTGDPVVYNLDGTSTTMDVPARGPNGSPSKATISAKVGDDGSITLHTEREMTVQGNAMTFKTTEVWQLADGGKTLKVKRTSDGRQGTQESSLVFAKQ